MTTWNPADKDANITLSGGNLVATQAGSSFNMARGTTSKPTSGGGKWYFEVVVSTLDAFVGVATSSANLGSFVGSDAHGWGVWSSNDTAYNNGASQGTTPLPIGAGTNVGVLLDLDAGTLRFRYNGDLGVSPPTYTLGLSGNVFPAAGFGNSSSGAVLGKFTTADCTYSPPAGFTVWQTASGPVLSSPAGTVTSNTAATVTHTTDTPGTGNTYTLRRTGGSAATAATIIATGVSAATGGSGSQSRSVTALGGTANQFWDIAQDGPSNVITVGPLSTATTLSSPTGAATGTTTATAGFTTDRAVSAAFPAYFLTLPAATAAPADAAALIANGATVSQTTGGTTPTRGIVGLTAATAYRTHMAQPGSNVVSSGSYTTSASGTAPTITVQPSNQTVTAGATATFSVTATGSGLTYQWRRNGTNISGATSSSYSFSTVLGDSGAVFSVVVTGDTAPAATSSNATLTVNAAPPPPPPPAGPTLPAVATDATGSTRRTGQTTRMVVEPFTNIESLGTGVRTIATGTTDATTGEITLTGLSPGTYAVFGFFPSTGATIQGVRFRLVTVS